MLFLVYQLMSDILESLYKTCVKNKLDNTDIDVFQLESTLLDLLDTTELLTKQEFQLLSDIIEVSKITSIDLNEIRKTKLKHYQLTNELKQIERTDYDLIPNVTPIHDYKQFIFNIVQEELDAMVNNQMLFHDPRCNCVNKNKNYYMLDKLNIVIKQNCQNKNQVYGWKYDENNQPISIHNQFNMTDDENFKHILDIQFQLDPKSFIKKTGIINKIYSSVPELKVKLLEFLETKNVTIE